MITASASRRKVLSRLNTRSACAPVHASTRPSQTAPHDSGSVWVATSLRLAGLAGAQEMKQELLCAVGCAVALVAATAPVNAQNTRPADRQANQERRESTQFDDQARQTAHDWCYPTPPLPNSPAIFHRLARRRVAALSAQACRNTG